MTHTTTVLSAPKKFSPVRILAMAGIVLMSLTMFLARAHADISPSLSLSLAGDGNTVNVNVYGSPSESVYLYYLKPGSASQIMSLGNTDSNGNLSTTVSSSYYGIVAQTPVHVTVNGINGLASPVETWPNISTTINGSITLSSTGMVLSVGQTNIVTATNNTTGTLYVSNNSNPSIANISVSGNSITATGNTYGSSTVTICSTSDTTNCPSIYVTVQNSGGQSLVFSQNTLTVAAGQSVPVTVSGGNGIYTILNNSNPSIITSSISGSTITLGTSQSSGTSAITVCSSDMSACGIINATAGLVSSTAITFSQTNPTLPLNQSTPIGIYGGSGSYYVSSNSNSNIVQASISGSTLTLIGVTTGTSAVTVCASTGGCGTITATTSYSGGGGQLTLSQSSLSLLTGQTLSITISGGTAPYSLTVPSTSLYSASISGNVLTVEGLSSGSNQLAVCSAAGGCVWLTLQVNGSTVAASGAPILSQTNVSLASGQTTSLSISGNGSYYISSNASPSIASVAVSGSTLLISALNSGTDTVSVCQNNGACTSVFVSVNTTTGTVSTGQASLLSFGTSLQTVGVGQSILVPITGGTGSYYVAYNSNASAASATISGSSLSVTGQQTNSLDVVVVCSGMNSCGALPIAVGVIASVPVTVPVVTTTTGTAGDGYEFTQFLSLGSQGTEVAELQKRLGELGYFSASDTGYFGPATKIAVEAFQSANGIARVGYVGPSTRAVLNR